MDLQELETTQSEEETTEEDGEDIQESYEQMELLLRESEDLFGTVRKTLARLKGNDMHVKNLIKDVASLETDIEMFLENELLEFN